MKRLEVARGVLATCLLALLLVPLQARAQVALKKEPPTLSDLAGDAYRWGDFAELERLFAAFARPGLRSESTGTPRMQEFWTGIGKINRSSLMVTDEYFQQLDLLTAQWARIHRESAFAQLLYASTLETHAWAHRGTGFSNTVSPAAQAEFRKYLDLSAAQLQRAEPIAGRDSYWHETMLVVGRSSDWDKRRLLAVFEAGIAVNPDDDNLYFIMLEALLPRWGGDLVTVERFIERVVKDTRERRGLEMYARLWAGVSYVEVKQTLFTNTRASWTSMKAGFEDRLKRFPHTDHRNMYAYFACMASDRPALQEQLQLIGDRFQANFWGSSPERTFEECKRLAQQI